MDDDSPDELLAKAESAMLAAEDTGYGSNADQQASKAQVYALMSIAASLSEIAKLS